MKVDLLFVAASGVMCVLMGGLVLASGRRLAPLLAGTALFLLGLQQLSWARAISWGQHNYWLELAFIGTLPVALAWLLLSFTLGRSHDLERLRGWRLYIALQALLSLAATVSLRWFSPVGRITVEGDHRELTLTSFGVGALGNLLVNITLSAGNFEATYLALSARWKRAFRPLLLSILLSAACYGYVIVSGILLRRVSIWEVGIASLSTVLVAGVMPVVLLRRRVAELSTAGPLRPVRETASFVLGAALIGLLIVLVQVSRWTGWTLVRTAWISIFCAALVGLTAIVLSNRFQRLLQRLLEPYLQSPRFDPELVWSRLSRELDAAPTRQHLLDLIPAETAEITGIETVTLFMAEGRGGGFVVAGSTLRPAPDERVEKDEPLARVLGSSRNALHLRGRSDDLGLIPVYVENAKQIAACGASCAVPLYHEGKLIGFLLCGDPERGIEKPGGALLLLEVIAHIISPRLASPKRRA